jgi:hypothetical protein
MIVAPIFSEQGTEPKGINNKKQNKTEEKFEGLITSTIDLDEIPGSFLSIDSANKVNEHIWILAKNGSVIYQSDHPEMIMNNIYQQDQSCIECHDSFKHVQAILSENSGTTEYQLKNGPQKLASFVSLNFNNISWRVVVNVPLGEITSFVYNNLIISVQNNLLRKRFGQQKINYADGTQFLNGKISQIIKVFIRKGRI